MFSQYLSNILGVSQDFIQSCDDNLIKKLYVKKGEILLREGELCKEGFFVEKGLLRMYSISKNAKEHIIQFAPENWLVTDRSSVFFNEVSDYYIDAIEDSEIISLNRDFFNHLQKNNPEIWANHAKLLHNHARSLQKRINLLLGATAEERYLDFMKIYPNILQRVPLWMVASYLGITPESLSRVRKGININQI